MSKEEKTQDAVVVDEWRLFACATLPKHRPEYDEIIKLYFETRDEKYYEWLLDSYEPRLNTLARRLQPCFSIFDCSLSTSYLF